MTKILVVDNYDSFVYTLNGYVQQLGADTDVIRNDAVSEDELADRISAYDGVLLSPGPGTPADAGVSIAAVHSAIAADKPLLGVCLGHQAIAEALGATVTHADELMHGKTSQVDHDDSTLFAGVPHPFTATRYHSLAVEPDSIPAELEVTARTEGGVVMAMRHREADLEGVQFHPESVLTEGGHRMLGTWLARCGETEAPVRALSLRAVAPAG